ncbi:MAG TPA: DUF2786 domain-containing protein [Acidimicrobiales bacterium]
MRERSTAGSPGDGASLDGAVEAAVASAILGAVPPAPHLVAALARWSARGPDGPGGDRTDPVDRALAGTLVAAVAAAWQRGWQPADLHRVVERRVGRAPARLAAHAIAHEARRHAPAEVPARWRLQLDAIGATARDGSAAGHPWAVPWPAGPPGGEAPPARLQAVEAAVLTVALVRSLPTLPRLGPIPGEAAPAPGRVDADPRVLRKVTSLLAKAESTSFPDEAEALTAKAQELMTRHAISRAQLDARRGGGAPAAARRIGIDDPYAGARYLLLSAVADANRCRAVWTRQWGFSTVFGDEGDLDTVELLYTSLLVQATRAMVAEPRPRSSSPADTRSFRQSFLVAFAQRVGERLARATEAVTADEARRSTALVPLLDARRQAADEALRRAFPEVRTSRLSARNAHGWHAGTRAADRAQLELQRPVGRGARRALA